MATAMIMTGHTLAAANHVISVAGELQAQATSHWYGSHYELKVEILYCTDVRCSTWKESSHGIDFHHCLTN
jgi:hypothetical protein